MAAAIRKVYPRTADAMNVSVFRNDRPELTLAGALWPVDAVTHILIAEGALTYDEALRYVPPPQPDPAEAAASE